MILRCRRASCIARCAAYERMQVFINMASRPNPKAAIGPASVHRESDDILRFILELAVCAKLAAPRFEQPIHLAA